jgi:hypothetical protein
MRFLLSFVVLLLGLMLVGMLLGVSKLPVGGFAQHDA